VTALTNWFELTKTSEIVPPVNGTGLSVTGGGFGSAGSSAATAARSFGATFMSSSCWSSAMDVVNSR
jgi:hypothetical protein